jgi:hypothetical protein
MRAHCRHEWLRSRTILLGWEGVERKLGKVKKFCWHRKKDMRETRERKRIGLLRIGEVSIGCLTISK